MENNFKISDIMTISDLIINNAGFFLLAELKSNPIDEEEFKRLLRQCFLDIKDTLSSEAVELPMVIVFDEISKEAHESMEKIRKLAGDQDWHRGDFSIIVLPDQKFGEIAKDFIDFYEELEFEKVSLKEIAKTIEKNIDNINEEDKRFEKEYKNAMIIISKSLLNTGEIEKGFEDWKEEIKERLEKLNQGEHNE